MADYWRFQDGGQPVSAHVKRPRADYDDVPLTGSIYLPREEPRFDTRDGRYPWMESSSLGMGLDGTRNTMAYAPGSITSSDMSGAAGAPYMGLNGAGQFGDSKLGIASLNDPSLAPQGGRMMGGMDLGVQHGLNGAPKQDAQLRGLAVPGMEATHTLYVEGLPADCSRREAAHIFRPFLGFQEVRLVRKEGKRDGDQFILCFVDFTDPKSASIALEALQGYKFDENDRESPALRLQYSRYPGSRPGARDGPRGPRDRDANRPFRR
ncbi:hypothetical protein GOP47_0007376 [Adiantum capillus-veneris]|uniref:RRM domain-containing protein n=1 Tax=Adiantum capillus-veneris TaxID=13818 RepID=A0A9D4V1E5_ADICA|nr:hypothetical protein GOP47_0007376 [Adiantum capillus-veneris]